ncbi:MAG: CDP-alcohol phosphatidyltransferase family protein [Saprospiraceae bacterium]|nr:CDP-alcohol phosphatidyltransferase family protein [Saprospiraceae bacterium]
MKHIPNSITLINVFAGCCASICLFADADIWAIGFIMLAGMADFGDGLAARLLGVSSPVGKELDSLADMISFGFVPGLIAYKLLDQASGQTGDPINWIAIPGFAITIFSAVRLARFNLDERQTQDFIGLNTPTCTAFFAGLLALGTRNIFGISGMLDQVWVLYLLIGLFSWLMNTDFPMFSFKFKQLSWKGNEIRYIFMVTTIVFFILLKEAAFSALVIVYILLAIAHNMFAKSNKQA